MNNRERKFDFIDSYDANDSFNGDFSKLKAIPLTKHQVNLVNKILLGEKIKLTVVWVIYTSIITILLLFTTIENLFQAVLLILFFSGDIIWMLYILKKWMKDRCRKDGKAYRGVVINKFYLQNKSERKYFVSVKLSNNEIIYKAKLSRLVKKYVDISDSILIVPLFNVVIIPYESDVLL